MVKDFRIAEGAETPITLSQPRMNKLVVQVPGNAVRYSGNFGWMNFDEDQGWDINDDSLKLSNIRVNVKQSEDSLYHVTVFRYSNGDTRAKALRRAERIDFTVTATDSVLQLPSGFAVSENDKFRNQRVLVEIKIPVGRQIRFDRSVGEKLNPFNIRVSDNDRYGRKRNWGRRDYRFEWDDNYYEEWEPDTDYYMTADGKLKQVGIPETEKPATPVNSTKDSLIKEYQKKIDSVESTGREADTDEEQASGNDEETTKKKEIGGDLPTPMPVPFVPTIF
jgi:hypothetical protein